jgi:hypothetical protein
MQVQNYSRTSLYIFLINLREKTLYNVIYITYNCCLGNIDMMPVMTHELIHNDSCIFQQF